MNGRFGGEDGVWGGSEWQVEWKWVVDRVLYKVVVVSGRYGGGVVCRVVLNGRFHCEGRVWCSSEW